MNGELPGRPGGSFHVMTKPFGPICNLACQYCYYLEKERLYPAVRDFRMPPEVLESFVRQYLRSQDTPEVTFGWQGGEPTLLGLEFFRQAVRLQARYAEGRKITNTIQTNGTTLTDEWCEFFSDQGFLVGISVDGPGWLHDGYRVDKGGKPTFQKVMAGLGLLKKHGTPFNTLTVVNRANSQHPMEVYRFLKEAGSTYLQFIPLVERKKDSTAAAMGLDLAGPPSRDPGDPAPPVTHWSVQPRQFGEFLVTVFEAWVRADVGRVFVQLFDETLAKWVGAPKGHSRKSQE